MDCLAEEEDAGRSSYLYVTRSEEELPVQIGLLNQIWISDADLQKEKRQA